MSIRKKDVLLFVDKVESKAVASVKEKYSTLRQAEKVQAMHPHTAILDSVQNFINDAYRTFESLQQTFDDKVFTFNDKYYGNVKRDLGELAGKAFINKFISTCSFVEVTKLDQLQAKEIKEIEAEYEKVKGVCKEKTAKQALAYLKDVGFDVSALEETKQLPVPQVDTRKLFVCGERK